MAHLHIPSKVVNKTCNKVSRRAKQDRLTHDVFHNFEDVMSQNNLGKLLACVERDALNKKKRECCC
jgi:hypothetical protein